MRDDGMGMAIFMFFVFSMIGFCANILDQTPIPVYVVTAPAPKVQEQKITQEMELALAGITCPRCAHVPKGLQRLEDVKLVEGATVPLPTRGYLAHLAKVCANKREEFGREDCVWRLSEVQFGFNDVYSRVNPPYGRPSFTERELKHVQWGSSRVGELLNALEYHYVDDERKHYLKNKWYPV